MARRRNQVARGTQESRADAVRLGGSGMERSQRRGPSSWVKMGLLQKWKMGASSGRIMG